MKQLELAIKTFIHHHTGPSVLELRQPVQTGIVNATLRIRSVEKIWFQVFYFWERSAGRKSATRTEFARLPSEPQRVFARLTATQLQPSTISFEEAVPRSVSPPVCSGHFVP